MNNAQFVCQLYEGVKAAAETGIDFKGEFWHEKIKAGIFNEKLYVASVDYRRNGNPAGFEWHHHSGTSGSLSITPFSYKKKLDLGRVGAGPTMVQMGTSNVSVEECWRVVHPTSTNSYFNLDFCFTRFNPRCDEVDLVGQLISNPKRQSHRIDLPPGLNAAITGLESDETGERIYSAALKLAGSARHSWGLMDNLLLRNIRVFRGSVGNTNYMIRLERRNERRGKPTYDPATEKPYVLVPVVEAYVFKDGQTTLAINDLRVPDWCNCKGQSFPLEVLTDLETLLN